MLTDILTFTTCTGHPHHHQTVFTLMWEDTHMPDNEIDVNEPEIIIPDPEPNPTIWAVTETSYRAVLSADDLQPGETLVIGDRPVIQEQRADAALLRTQLLAMATEKIAPLQDAIDLNMATDDEKALLTAWKKYRVLLMRIDTATAPDITWPEQPTTL
jgi:hypothetical protein